MKFRKKPVVIEAEQWLGPESEIEGVRETPNASSAGGFFFVETLEGPLHVSPGDWIITGVKGEKYPCKPDVFEATYEKVEVEEKAGPGKIEYSDAKIDTFNKFLVGLRGNEIAIIRPPLKVISVDDALLLAAYLVVMADPLGEKFDAVREAVENT